MKRKEEAFWAAQALIVVGVLALVALPSNSGNPSHASSSTTMPTTSRYDSLFTSRASFHSTVSSPSHLELRVDVNTTVIHPGGAIAANVTLFNPLARNFSLVAPDYSANPTLREWNDYAFVCDGALNPITSILSYAVFQGSYSAANISQAGKPFVLVPPASISCIKRVEPTSIVVIPNSDAGILSGLYETLSMHVATEYCTSSTFGAQQQMVVTCPLGNSLFGYWPPTATSGYLSSKEFNYFTPGIYTLAVEDVWNDSVFIHFTVTSG
jgi:hypothetical protein